MNEDLNEKEFLAIESPSTRNSRKEVLKRKDNPWDCLKWDSLVRIAVINISFISCQPMFLPLGTATVPDAELCLPSVSPRVDDCSSKEENLNHDS